jgi:hypothetical protein
MSLHDSSAEDESRRSGRPRRPYARPTWLAELHRSLDVAALSTSGWPLDITDEEILSRLLALNHERAGVGRR